MSYFANVIISQDVVPDPLNSSTANLAFGATFTGTSVSTIGYVGVRVVLKASENCTVQIQQSADGSNWDISDSYQYLSAAGGNSWTVQCVSSYYRVLLTNDGDETTTFIRLASSLSPIVNPLPRALNPRGRLRTESQVADHYGFDAQNTPTGDSRVATVTKLAGTSFYGTTIDSNFVATSVENGGTVTQGLGLLTLQTDTTANGSAIAYTVANARYSAGSSMRYRSIVRVMDSWQEDNKRRWGIAWGATMPTITDGAYFQIDGTTFSVVTLKSSSETVVSSGSFSGDYGTTYELDTSQHTYEIYWTNTVVHFVIDENIIHSVIPTTETWTDTLSFHAFVDNVNSNGLATNEILYCNEFSIARMGPLLTQPRGYYQAGTTAGVNLKRGPGSLHGLVVSDVNDNSVVTLYDNTAASGNVLWSSGAMPKTSIPFDLDFKGISFNIGLTLVVSAANSNVTVLYE